MNIVFASHTEMGGTFVVGSHHLAREFARLGHRVAHLGPPISLAHLTRVGRSDVRSRFALWARGGELDQDGVINYVGLSPLPWRLALKLGRDGWNLYARTLPSMRRVLQRYGLWPVDVLLVDQPQLAGLETLLRPRLLVYRATDLYGQMMKNPVVDAAERRIARAARLLVGTSEPVLAHLRSIASAPTMLLENGVEFDRFATTVTAPSDYHDIPAPRAVYAGALDERFDIGAIETLAQAGGVSIVLIGPASANVTAAFASRPNVFLLGPRRYESLPAYLQHAQIGLLPLTDHPANEGRSPMKLFEYGAAGLPVVATATRELSRRALPFVVLAKDAADFREGVFALLKDSGRCQALGAAARKISRSYGWQERASMLARALKQMETGVPEDEVPGELATISGSGTDY